MRALAVTAFDAGYVDTNVVAAGGGVLGVAVGALAMLCVLLTCAVAQCFESVLVSYRSCIKSES